MPDFPRPKVIVDPAPIWQYPDRTLTRFTDQPRIDLLGEDASFEDGRGLRKQLIDRLANVAAFDYPIEGTVAMDGTEKTVVLDEIEVSLDRYLEGYIDLSPMQDGDTVVVRQYIKISPRGEYVKYAEETIEGAQSLPLLYIVTKPCRYGIKITLEQTSGTYRAFDYQFFRRSTIYLGIEAQGR